MEAYLAQANMPSRAEVISLAQRLTSVEMRLDDMDARLDEILGAVRALALPTPAAAAPDPRLDEILGAVRALTEAAPAAPAPKPAPRRRQKAAAE
jgi:hypothetical protein